MKMSFLTLFLAAVAPAIPAHTQQQAASIPKEYVEIAGDYEYYVPKAYAVTHVTVRNGVLWSQDEGAPSADKLIPVDLRSLTFRVDSPNTEQFLQFVRDPGGRISSFLLTVTQGSTTLKLNGKRITRRVRQFGDRFSVQELTEDLLKVREALERLHPALYEFTDKVSFERLFDEQLRRLDRPMTVAEFYKVVAPFVAAVGCAHTRVLLPETFWTDAPSGRFPLRLTFLGEKAYVTGFYDAGSRIPPGSNLITINGQTVPVVLRALGSMLSSDGRREPYKLAVLARQFDRHAALEFGFPDTWVVTYALPSGTGAHKAELRAVDAKTIQTFRDGQNRPPSSGDPNLSFEALEPSGTAVLTIRSFDYYDDPSISRFQGFVDNVFARVRSMNLRNLVLDLRGNSGGSPQVTTHLLSYIEPFPVPYFAKDYGGGYEAYARAIPRAASPYTGRLFTLIDGGGVSSMGHFCALLKYHRIGTLVGTETGGTFECNDASHVVNLWNTGMRMAVARITFTAAVDGMSRNRGVVPDHIVEPRIEDVVLGQDAVKAYVFALIAKEPR